MSDTAESAATPWWRTAVVYEVYIRSFADGDGDGLGDIAGIRSRLPYLRGLGVDAIWVTPWYPWWTRLFQSDQALGRRRARAAALLEFALPGVAYVYQGDELGLPEVLALPSAARQDPTFFRTDGAMIGSDGDRVPLPWSGEAPPYGFGPAGSRPWLPQPTAWGRLSVAAQDADRASMLSLYRAALKVRRSHPGLRGEAFRWADDDRDDVLHFEREVGFRCVVNFGTEPLPLPSGTAVLLRSDGPTARGPLPRDAAAWYLAR